MYRGIIPTCYIISGNSARRAIVALVHCVSLLQIDRLIFLLYHSTLVCMFDLMIVIRIRLHAYNQIVMYNGFSFIYHPFI
jgi:hypothetical protein